MQQHTPYAAPQPGGTCLIVDDSEFDSRKMARVVSRSMGGMKVAVASTLASARRALEKEPAALILLDNNLPDGLGANFAMELAQNKQLADIPVIIVSDWPSPFMWQKAASAGVRYVLNKAEFDARYLLAALAPLGKKRRKPSFH